MAEFLIGCTHFGHRSIIGLVRRPFPSVAAMNEAMIANWNRVVGPEDHVWHLGDVAYRGAPAEDYLARLNGTVHRIQGNHDRPGWGADVVTIRHGATDVVLCHHPIEGWDGVRRGAVHFHAHTHRRPFHSGVRRGHVGADAIGFTPIRLEHAVAALAWDEAGLAAVPKEPGTRAPPNPRD